MSRALSYKEKRCSLGARVEYKFDDGKNYPGVIVNYHDGAACNLVDVLFDDGQLEKRIRVNDRNLSRLPKNFKAHVIHEDARVPWRQFVEYTESRSPSTSVRQKITARKVKQPNRHKKTAPKRSAAKRGRSQSKPKSKATKKGNDAKKTKLILGSCEKPLVNWQKLEIYPAPTFLKKIDKYNVCYRYNGNKFEFGCADCKRKNYSMGNFTAEILGVTESTKVAPNEFRRYLGGKFRTAAKTSCLAVTMLAKELRRFGAETRFEPTDSMTTCPHCNGSGFIDE